MLGLPEVRGAIPNSVYDGFSGDDLRNSRGPSLETLRPETKPVAACGFGNYHPIAAKGISMDTRPLCLVFQRFAERSPTPSTTVSLATTYATVEVQALKH